MNKMQEQLRDFHAAMEQPIGCTNRPSFINENADELRVSLICEEVDELIDSIRKKNMILTIDGICDVLYVIIGTAVAFGIDIEPFFDEVHRTNMLKATGPIREDGKRLKPEGWEPPKIKEILSRVSGEL